MFYLKLNRVFSIKKKKKVLICVFFIMMVILCICIFPLLKKKPRIDSSFEEYLASMGITEYSIKSIDYSGINKIKIDFEDENVDDLVKEYINDEIENYVTYEKITNRLEVQKNDYITVRIISGGSERCEKIRVGLNNYDEDFEKWIIGKKIDKIYHWGFSREDVRIIKIENVIYPEINDDFEKYCYNESLRKIKEVVCIGYFANKYQLNVNKDSISSDYEQIKEEAVKCLSEE